MDTSPLDENYHDDTSVQQGHVLDKEITSPFERLPRELLWEIFAYAPDTVFELRLVSRLLQSHVHEYALQKVNTIDKLIVIDKGYQIVENRIETAEIVDGDETQDDDATVTHIKMVVHKYMDKLFELRLTLLAPFFDKMKLIKRTIRRNEPGKIKINEIGYILEINSLSELERKAALKCLEKCMGRRVGRVELWLDKMWNELPIIFSLFDEIQLRQMRIQIHWLTNKIAKQLFQFAKANGVDDIFMHVGKVDTSLNSVEILLEISTIVRCMGISQNSKYLLGGIDVKWGQIILEMFAKKLDTLYIYNAQNEYLSKDSADMLMQHLPTIGKKIWFAATCKRYYCKENEYTTNDHIIIPRGTLRIIHSSRRNERFPFE